MYILNTYNIINKNHLLKKQKQINFVYLNKKYFKL